MENQIIVELIALVNLEDVHLAQAKNYVVAYDFPIGLLINFGAISVQFKKYLTRNTMRRNNNCLNKDLQDLRMNGINKGIKNPANPIIHKILIQTFKELAI